MHIEGSVFLAECSHTASCLLSGSLRLSLGRIDRSDVGHELEHKAQSWLQVDVQIIRSHTGFRMVRISAVCTN